MCSPHTLGQLRPLCAQSPEARDLVTGLLCRWRRGNDWRTGRPGLFQAPIHGSNAGSGWQQPGQLKTKGVQQCRVRLCSLPDLSWPQAWGLRRRRGFPRAPSKLHATLKWDMIHALSILCNGPLLKGPGLLANPVAMGTTQKDEVYLRHVTSGRIAKGASRGLAKRVDRCQGKSL